MRRSRDDWLAGPPMEATVCAEDGPSPGRSAATSEPDRLLEGRGRILVDPLAVTDEHMVGLDGEQPPAAASAVKTARRQAGLRARGSTAECRPPRRRRASAAPGTRARPHATSGAAGAATPRTARVGCANPVTLLVGTRGLVRRGGRGGGEQPGCECCAHRSRCCGLVERVGGRGAVDARCSGSCTRVGQLRDVGVRG
jgi:hypothetical protein